VIVKKTLTGIVLDERYELTVTEICRACYVSQEWVTELVAEGVLEPVAGKPGEWRFPGTSLARARTAMHLQRDLGLNIAGVALALDMLDEIEALRARLRRFETD
jgi:chaperone modulatory protein CbpM